MINVLNVILNDVISGEQATLVQCLINELQNQEITNFRNPHFAEPGLSSRNRPVINSSRISSALGSGEHFGQRFSNGRNPAFTNSSFADLDNNWRN